MERDFTLQDQFAAPEDKIEFEEKFPIVQTLSTSSQPLTCTICS